MDGENEIGAFSRALTALKHSGCSLLVVGSVCDGAHRELSRRLLGDASDATRRRLVVDIGARDRRSDEIDADTYRVIDRTPAVRSVSAGVPNTSNIDTLERDTIAAIEEFDAAADGLSPAELRVCVDSLQPLVETHGTDRIEPFLDAVIDRIHTHHGIGHFHLPIERECDAVAELEHLFDIVVELRPGEYRWHVLADDIITDWISM